jgi:hypothetical protein
MFKVKEVLSYIFYVMLALSALAFMYVVFSHLSGPKYGESCGPHQRWRYNGGGMHASQLSCEPYH